MKTSVKLDWFCFSFPRENSDMLGKLLDSLFTLEDHGAGKWHKKIYRVHSGDPKTCFQLKIHPRTSNGMNEVEMGGSWLSTREREEQAVDLMKYCSGRLSRLDIAFDLKWVYGGDPMQECASYMELESVGPKKGKNVTRMTDGYGMWTGLTVGYGKGSEVCLRIYDKKKEQKKKAGLEFETDNEKNGWLSEEGEYKTCDDDWWWRVEVTIRGDTLKCQEKWWFQTLDGLYDLGRGFLASRYHGWPSWFAEPKTVEIKPRSGGVASLENRVVYWQRRLESDKRKLLEISQSYNPREVLRHEPVHSDGNPESDQS